MPALLQRLDGRVLGRDALVQERDKPAPVDEAGVLRPDVEKAEHVRTGRAQHPFPEHIQASRYIRGTNHRADGRAADDVGLETGIDQRVDHADVRPAA